MPTIIQDLHEEITNELRHLKTIKDEDHVIVNFWIDLSMVVHRKKRETVHNKKFIHMRKPFQRAGGYRIEKLIL